ncbi:HNH endonuclease [Bacillus atrophaeus]|uniref:HNH endonuclease n=1 Tax=Bacillus atrophaeus TaxID=1452 RepID=UPI00227E45BB|nr:HNH endonuclease [Bacillus atrophaeus]MCY8498418.1 HNH endonuclease [Bacillus atrophaeus]MCY8812518.1 HNH endonuclease [Bacillus atrophaeus]MCY8819216.1 HNH endonuclease [Bacillus atrophaeus]MCY8827252.1 HNH endonuclease [Bacillus atrophaeus]MCY8832834.1 HNH endonuclease [Bacillus atrophaeus]
MHFINSEGKYFTKAILIEANNAAIREDRNRQLNEHYLESLSDDKVFPIILAIDEHNRGEIRVQIIFDDKGAGGFLDMTKKRYNNLPQATFNEDGTIELESEEALNVRRPYPPGREYVEKVVRTVVRDKGFREKILSAYSNECAMCEVNERSSLVAAHIYPAHLCSDDSVNNGICLCSNHDKAYERGNICITAEGDIIVRDPNSKVDYHKIRFPKLKDDYPSTERLNQRLEISKSKSIEK